MKTPTQKLIAILLPLVLLLILVPAVAFPAQAASSGTCGDNLTWTLDDEGTLTISGTGAMTDYSSYSSVPWYSSRTSIANVVIDEGVTSIGYGAFYNCTGLTSITIPDSVTSIGSSAFRNCTGLTSITIPDSVTSIGSYAFYNCTGLTSVHITDIASWCKISFSNSTANPLYYGEKLYLNGELVTDLVIPDSVTSIGDYAFRNCTGLTSITIPDSVTSIGSDAFYKCTGLTSVHITDIASWCKISFDSASANPLCYAKKLYLNGELVTDLVIPDSVTSIGDYAFYNCTGLTSIQVAEGNSVYHSAGNCLIKTASKALILGCQTSQIPQDGSVTSIGERAFYNCTGLTSITIPDSVTGIGYSAFHGCKGLTSVTIPDSVTSIGNYAFYNCKGLEEINFNATAMADLSSSNYVFAYAGQDGNGITVNIGANVTKVPAYLFDPYDNSSYAPKIKTVNFAEGSVCTSIGNYAFYNCTGLTSVHITDIASWCKISFSNSTANPLYYGEKLYLNGELVTDLVIPDSVTSIGDYAFRNCTGLTSITIPDSVTSIGNSAFSGCTGLTSITIPDSVTSIGNYAFCNCEGVEEINFNATAMVDLSFSNCAFAYAGQDGNGITVNIGANVTKVPAYLFYPDWVPSYAPKITTVNFAEGSVCASIGDYAFRGCTGLTSVTIPDSVTSIGSYAFYNCTGLTSVHITDIASWCKISFDSASANPLYYAKKLYLNGELVTDLVIPDSVTSIGDYAFYNCTGLTSITLGDSVTSIGDHAFYYCTGLTSIQVAEGNSVYHSAGNCLIETASKALILGCKNSQIPTDGSVTSIGKSAFYYCTGLTSITIPDSVTSIGSYAFSGCTGLTSITIPDSVTSIGDSAFYECTGLTSITIPDSVTSIGDSAFYNCTGLTSVTIGNGVTSIGYDAFYNCKGLEEINFNATAMKDLSSSNYAFAYAGQNGNGITVNIGANVTKVPAYLFNPHSDSAYAPKITTVNFAEDSVCASIGNDAFYYCTGLTSVHITDIASWCKISFSNSTANPLYYGEKLYLNGELVTDLVIPDSVTSIGDYAFYNCTGLTSITIPNSVTSIGDYAFRGCTGLTSVTIPDSVTSIGSYAFYNCTGLTSVTIPDSVTSIGGYAFRGCTGLKTVYYYGTEEDRTKLQIGSYNTTLTNATWHYVQAIQFCGQDCYYCAECGKSMTVDGQDVKATVKFLSEDGNLISENTYYYEEKIVIPAVPEKPADNTYTYAFANWDKTVSATCVGDATYTAVYTPNYIDYTVEFKNWDGRTISTATYHYGDSIQQPENPTKATDPVGTYTFTGWDKPVVNCAGNATYTAVYTTNYTDYTVEFKNWDGTLISSKTYHYGDTVEIPGAPGKVPDKTFYYIFTGWNKSVVNCEGNATYIAVYSPMYIDYTVTFVNWDGTKVADKTYHYGDTVEAPADPTRPDGAYITYTFAGWTPEITACQGNTTYTATYLETVYLQEALQEASQTGGTVKLTQDTQVVNLVLWNGATLDLNGYTLEAEYFTAFGNVVDGTMGGNGLLKINQGIHLAEANDFLPIYDTAAGGYRLYKYELQNLGFKTVSGDSDTLKAGFRLSLANTAGYSVLANTTDDAVGIATYVSWTGIMGKFTYRFNADTVRNYAALVAADIAAKGSSSKAITLNLTGLSGLADDAYVEAQPAVDTNTGVSNLGLNVRWEKEEW